VAEWLLRFREPCCTSTLKCNKHHIIIYIYISIYKHNLYIFIIEETNGFCPSATPSRDLSRRVRTRALAIDAYGPAVAALRRTAASNGLKARHPSGIG
jgi:hypothetical protein